MAVAVDWDTIKELGKKAKSQWDTALKEARGLKEPHRSVAIEHIYLFVPATEQEEEEEEEDPVKNVFCPTGPGGGVDPHCGGGSGRGPNVNLTAEEIRAVRESDVSSTGVNDALRSGRDLKEESKLYPQRVAALDSAINKSVLEHDMVVYRGANVNTPSEGVFIDQGFTITSRDRKVAEGFGSVVVEVRLRKGQRALDVDLALGRGKDVISDKEIILPRGQTYRAFLDGTKRVIVVEESLIENIFCPTGPGGGIDPHCGKKSVGTRNQQRTITQLREAFNNADTFDLVEQEKRVLVFMSLVTSDYKRRLHNEFAIGMKGGLKVIKHEFDGDGPLVINLQVEDRGSGEDEEEDDLTAKPVENVFCPTGPGGGIDPHCGKGGGTKGVPISAQKHSILGYEKDSLIRWMGKRGWSFDSAKAVLDSEGLSHVSDDSIRAQLEAGKKKDAGRASVTVADANTFRDIASRKGSPVGGGPKQKKGDIQQEKSYPASHIADLTDTELAKISEGKQKVKTSGMSEERIMDRITVDGVKVHWEEGTENGMTYMAKQAKNVHPELWKQNKEMYFTNQSNREDKLWEREYGMPGFKSLATAGNGTIVVYSGTLMGSDILAHESAHNLASNMFGNVDIARATKFPSGASGMKYDAIMDSSGTRVRNAITNYGSVSRSEDFAEFVAAYSELTVGKKTQYKGSVMRDLERRPETLKTVRLLLGEKQ